MSKKYPGNAEYNKLVRDRIPEIIRKDGLEIETKKLSEEEIIDLLKEKLIEEGNELKEAEGEEETKKEMADVLEVIYSLAERQRISLEEVESVRKERAEKRGSFKKGIFLVRTKEKK